MASVLCMLWVFSGCSDDLSIRQYKVAKRKTPPRVDSAARVPQQILGAIVPQSGVAWFFKLTGDPAKVAEADAEFRSVVETVTFDDSGKPVVKFSGSWSQQTTNDGITFAKYMHASLGLTATVSDLAASSNPSQAEWQMYVRGHVNRWRGQLALPEQTWDAMAAELEELPKLSQGSAAAYFVSLIGTGSGSSPGGGIMPPFMSGLGGPSSGALPSGHPDIEPSSSAATNPAATKKLTYSAPAGWTELPANGIRLAAFSLRREDEAMEVSVTAAGGETDQIVGMWLGQVGTTADKVNVDRVIETATPIVVNGLQSTLYSASAPDDSQQILVAEIPWQLGESLFAKVKGASAMVETERGAFLDFLSSLRW